MKAKDSTYSNRDLEPLYVPDNHVVMNVNNGKANFLSFRDIDVDTQKRILEALEIVQQNVRKTKESDPAGDFATEPFGENWWCKIDVIDGALGVGCGIAGYWCSVWIHPDHGVAANCGNVNDD